MVRLLDAEGKLLAVSESYDSTQSAARGIFAIREIAASALIADRRGSPTLVSRSSRGTLAAPEPVGRTQLRGT